MSFLVGTASGALVAGGVYYGLSSMISTRAEQHRFDLHHLSERLVNASSDIPAPTPAAARIPQRHFVSMLQNSWNSQVEALFRHSGDLDQRVVDWARKTLYGGEADRAKPE
ncbi:uncharacterized protein TRAVEDRAFT_31464 [Trametes versicolor FP-101664 SS1]|uniref:uncharacterized protein n=1 Tax=Trametes versicolor (strain FP-101664) TaxID=717944 RepID=UPI00046224A1|nr:uncharacterized protein TRAVEDRAFT_31464 [Trametes versicolor FP-101664 SS1]EIW53215.1 hypothetical protein TRAVEDRAFT_31464 [Trametes versicolor FP-101664 SS1]